MVVQKAEAVEAKKVAAALAKKPAAVKSDQQQAAKEAIQRLPKIKEGKIIVRNLGFDLREKHLQLAFKKFGEIKEVTVPLSVATSMNRGFAFVEFVSRQNASEAITAMNGTKYKGRDLTVEFSVPKSAYEARIDNIV